jgi:hypothetical protein
MFDDIANLSSKKAPVRDPESYDRDVYQINRCLAMEDSLLPIMAEFSKYLWTLRGRYYLLLDGFIPQTNKRLFIKNVRRGKLENIDRQRINAVQQVTNYSGAQAYVAMEILRHEGIDVDRLFGFKEDKTDEGASISGQR